MMSDTIGKSGGNVLSFPTAHRPSEFDALKELTDALSDNGVSLVDLASCIVNADNHGLIAHDTGVSTMAFVRSIDIYCRDGLTVAGTIEGNRREAVRLVQVLEAIESSQASDQIIAAARELRRALEYS